MKAVFALRNAWYAPSLLLASEYSSSWPRGTEPSERGALRPAAVAKTVDLFDIVWPGKAETCACFSCVSKSSEYGNTHLYRD